MDEKLKEFEKIIEYKFKDISLLKTALTHTSYAYENNESSYERLEYLGDSILEFISSECDFLYLGKSEISSKTNKKAILADSVEAVIAAIYLDSKDISIVRDFILKNISDQIEYASKNVGKKDYKTVLQERLQVHGEVDIKYTIIDEKGPDHMKWFTAQVECDGKKLAEGSGRSKKAAEMEAARKALEDLK